MEENGGTLIDGETKRRLKICLKSGHRKHKIQKVLGRVLSDQTKPPVEGDIPRDVKGDIRDLRPTSHKAKGGTSVIEKISAKYCG